MWINIIGTYIVSMILAVIGFYMTIWRHKAYWLVGDIVVYTLMILFAPVSLIILIIVCWDEEIWRRL